MGFRGPRPLDLLVPQLSARVTMSLETEDDGKTSERASAVFVGLCGHLVQEVSVGRTVHVPNLGLFFQEKPGQMRFKARGDVHKTYRGEHLEVNDGCSIDEMRAYIFIL